MSKYSRYLDEEKIHKSKEKTIDFVMNEINLSQSKKVNFSIYKLSLVLSVLLIAVVTTVVLNPFGNDVPNPKDEPLVLTTFETEKLAELSYISGRLIASSFSLDKNIFNLQLSNVTPTSSLLMLDDNETTEFENNIDEFNTYFDMLKVFLEEDAFDNAVTVTPVTDGDYDTAIEFFVDGKLYTFLVIVIDEEIFGELTINNQVFTVSGTFEQTDTTLKMEFIASSGSDYIKIKYQTENKDEIEKKYEIEQSIAGVLKEKQIKVSIEDGESKVEITENNDTYKLKKEIVDDLVVYKLAYKIDDQEGEVKIYETVDLNGVTIYSYKITEGNKYHEIDLDDPDEEDENHDQENHDDQEDQEDQEDHDDQANPYFEEIMINIL